MFAVIWTALAKVKFCQPLVVSLVKVPVASWVPEDVQRTGVRPVVARALVEPHTAHPAGHRRLELHSELVRSGVVVRRNGWYVVVAEHAAWAIDGDTDARPGASMLPLSSVARDLIVTFPLPVADHV